MVVRINQNRIGYVIKQINISTISRFFQHRCDIGRSALGIIQLESTSKLIILDVEDSSFGYDLTIGNLVKRGRYQRCVRTP